MILATFDSILPLKAIQERDIDFLLMEELSCNSQFQNWFLEKTIGISKIETYNVWHSLSEPGMGESDVVFKVTREHQSYIFLIENKLDAVFQPNQAGRYYNRGEIYKKKGECTSFYTVLAAPKYIHLILICLTFI